jgi:lipopolysaccharide transport system ATP-binding protein
MINENLAIKINNLSKSYSIGVQRESELRYALLSPLAKKTSKETFRALNDINISINKGDIVGIIGKNGAGKSTLLKILSQITKPTEGKIEINGRIASLLEVGTGFHPELTGRENIYLNGTILGMTRKEVKEKFDEIVSFSGVEKFIDTAVKHYSSGMYVRLAFAVAAHLEPEILIIDEVLAVGDAEFQKKCLGKMQDVAKQGRTVLFVSHHLGSIRQLCNKGILLEKGKLKIAGNIDTVIREYQQNNTQNLKYLNDFFPKEVGIEYAEIVNNSALFYHNEEINLKFGIRSNISETVDSRLLIRIIDEYEQVVFSSEISTSNKRKDYSATIPSNFLVKGSYKINSIIYQPGVSQFENISDLLNFEVLDNNEQFAHLETFDIGKIYGNLIWR